MFVLYCIPSTLNKMPKSKNSGVVDLSVTANHVTQELSLSPQELVEQQFQNVIGSVNTLMVQGKTILDELRSLQKAFKVAEKQSRQKKKRVPVPMRVSGDICKFLKVPNNSVHTRAEVMKMISEYIKLKQLQLESDKRKFIPDANLCKIFRLTESSAKPMTFVEINKYISEYLERADKKE